MTLGELIKALEAEDPNLVLPTGFHRPHSYRGYYDELAFEPAEDITIAAMLAAARSALNATFTGYKGGDYVMGEYTSCWLSGYGTASGESIGPTLLRLMIRVGLRQPPWISTNPTVQAAIDAMVSFTGPSSAEDAAPVALVAVFRERAEHVVNTCDVKIISDDYDPLLSTMGVGWKPCEDCEEFAGWLTAWADEIEGAETCKEARE